jgi:hypothetical protein
MHKAVRTPLPAQDPEKERTNGYILAPMICFHELVFIDPDGKSCGLCSIALEGYGVASPFPGKQLSTWQNCLANN